MDLALLKEKQSAAFYYVIYLEMNCVEFAPAISFVFPVTGSDFGTALFEGNGIVSGSVVNVEAGLIWGRVVRLEANGWLLTICMMQIAAEAKDNAIISTLTTEKFCWTYF